MALQQISHGWSSDLVRSVVLVVAIIALMLVATAIFGVGRTGPSYELTPNLGLPF
jgi:hypothetical protein